MAADRPADHHADDIVDLDVTRRDGADGLAVLHDGHAVSDIEDFVEAMGDIDDADAAIAQCARMISCNFIASCAASTEVGSSKTMILMSCDKRLGDLDHLLVGHGKREPAMRPGSILNPRRSMSSLARLRRLEWEMMPGKFAQEDVLRHSQVGRQRQFLMDDDDAEGACCVTGIAEDDGLAIDHDLAMAG